MEDLILELFPCDEYSYFAVDCRDENSIERENMDRLIGSILFALEENNLFQIEFEKFKDEVESKIDRTRSGKLEFIVQTDDGNLVFAIHGIDDYRKTKRWRKLADP